MTTLTVTATYIGGPLDGQSAGRARSLCRSAVTGAPLPAVTGDRALSTHAYGHTYKRAARDRMAALYLRQGNDYVWMPDSVGLDMTAPWVPFHGKPLAPYWTTGDVRFRNSWTGVPAVEDVALALIAAYAEGTTGWEEELALRELYGLAPDGYRRVLPPRGSWPPRWLRDTGAVR